MTSPASATMIRALILRHAHNKDDEVFGIIASLNEPLLQEMQEGLEFLVELIGAELKRRQKGTLHA